MKKILLSFLVTMLFCFSTVNANTINSIDIDIYITPNGDAEVTEIWNCVTNQGTESYHPYYSIGTSEITNLVVSDEDGITYEPQVSWNVNGSFEDKKYKSGIVYVSDGVELCWGISEYGSKIYTVNYNISDFVVNLEDAQMAYWTVIPHNFSTRINDAKVTIYSDKKFEDTLDVWGYGDYGGLAYVYDGKVEMQSENGINSNERVVFLIKFPTGTFNLKTTLNSDFNHYYEMAEEGAEHYVEGENNDEFGEFIIFFLFMLLTLGLIVLPVLIVYLGTETVEISPYDKATIKNASYFRDIPCDASLFDAFYIAHSTKLMKRKTDLMGALILKWLKEGKVKILKEEDVGFFKKEETSIMLNKEIMSELTNKSEKNLYNILYRASKDGVLEKNELETWCNKNYQKLLDWFDEILEDKKLEYLANDLILRVKLGEFLKRKRIILGKSVIQEAANLSGLKKYLNEYTLINERGAIEVELFENYLIFAQLMGIADRVIKEFKELYPDVIEASSYQNFDNVIFISNTANRGITSAQNARARAESYSSGGGGFSSGGGGGGSFGGGGGGGGGFR